MNRSMKLLSFVFLTAIFVLPSSGWGEQSLDTLLNKVLKGQTTQKAENIQREKEFLTKKEEQKKLLAVAKNELNQQEKIGQKLTGFFEKNEKKLSQLEEQLHLAMGTLGEMFGVVRQVAGDLKGQIDNSVVSAQIKGRGKFISRMANSKVLPEIKDLEQLWFELQREMTETGKVAQFESEVVTPDGERKLQKVTRVGAFNLVSNGSYLIYQSETDQLMELPRQPAGKFLSMIDDLESGGETIAAFGLDPSRGSILSLLVQAPNLWEKVQQGGIVGYVILALLALGLMIVGERYYFLKKESDEIAAQLKSVEIDEDNVLGKVMKIFQDHKSEDLEELELKMDEVILKKTPELTRGIGTIKILSGVAPLLGLLGTVTGMIVTFQSITLFGTGDPKLMAGGISQALVTTVLGLVCAIPLVLLHNVISNKSKRILQILDEQSAGLMAERVSQKG